MLTHNVASFKEAVIYFNASLLGDGVMVTILLQMALLFLTVCIDPYILKKQKRIIVAIIALIVTLIVSDVFSTWLEDQPERMPARTFLSIYNYAVWPLILLLLCHIFAPGRKHLILLILVVINAAVFLTALFSPVAFYITYDNKYHRGPLGYTAHIISGIILAYLLYLNIREARRMRRKESLIPILSILLIIFAVELDENTWKKNIPLSYLTIAVVSCALFVYIYLRLKFVRDHEDALMMNQQLQIMFSQIQPHFLYNSLTVIQELCHTDPAQAETATIQFAKYLRRNMDGLQAKTPIPFSEELEHTREYLYLEQMRFEDKLTVQYDIRCESFTLPPLTLQPIVENAVRHGVRGNSEGRGEVTISARETPGCYEIVVTDNGPGFNPEEQPENSGRSHIGIRNVRERLAVMCDGELAIQSAPGAGTAVTITLPKEKNALC